MHDGMPYGRNQGQGQGHSREVDRQSPTGLIFFITLRGRRAVRSRGYNLSRFCIAVYGSILMPFAAFFSEGIAYSEGLDSSHFGC